MRRSSSRATRSEAASCCSGRRRAPRSRPGATWNGRRRSRAQRPPRARLSKQPIRFTSCTRRARPVSRRAWCAITAGMRLPSRGRWRRSTACGREMCSGRPPTSVGWSATRTSSTRRCSPAAPASSTKASRSARRTPAPSGASSRSIGSMRYSRRRPRFAPSRRRIRTGRCSGATTSRACARCFWPVSAVTLTPCTGPRRNSGCR